MAKLIDRLKDKVSYRNADYVPMLLTPLSVACTAYLAIESLSSRTLWHEVAGVVAVVATFLAIAVPTGLTNRGESLRTQMEHRRIAKHLIEETLRATIPTFSRVPDQTGCVVFLPGADGRLYTAFSVNKEDKSDENMIVDPDEGAVGKAWQSRKRHVAHLDSKTPSQIQTEYRMTPQQIALTRDLKTVVTTPIVVQDAGVANQVGVLGVDCLADNATSGLDDPVQLAAIEQAASLVAVSLRFVGLV